MKYINKQNITKRGEFIEIMNEFISIKKHESQLNEAFKNFEPDLNYISFGRYESLVVKVIKIAMQDTSDRISYWIYELNFGKDAKLDSVKDKNGKSIPIKHLGDLYAILKREDL